MRPRGLNEEWRSTGWGEKGRGCQGQKGRMERLRRRRNSPSFSLSQNLPFLPFFDAFAFCVPVHKAPRVSNGPSLNSSFPSVTFLTSAAGPRPASAPFRPAPRWHISRRGARPSTASAILQRHLEVNVGNALPPRPASLNNSASRAGPNPTSKILPGSSADSWALP